MIILIGQAGSGKSTQGKLLADEYGYAWISSGDILRVLITGKRRQEMLRGNLLSDEEMIQVIAKVMDLIDPTNEFVLDGFPRTIAQADWILSEAEKGLFHRVIVINFEASEEVVRKRLIGRGRVDDNEEAIARRFSEYHDATLPILEHFREKGIPIYKINADQTPEAVHNDIVGLLKNQAQSTGLNA